jgi:SNF2 family DNA or RNA helicase
MLMSTSDTALLNFEVGSRVRCRNQVWEVGRITDNGDGSWTVRLYPEEGAPRSFLYPLTPIEPIATAFDHLERGHLDHIDHYRLLTSATRLSLVYEYDKLLSISNSKIAFEPYQLLAVKKVMESLRQRFLIADDVGLGKTIEAGLIMQELTARHRGVRILVVVPASLQDQWKKEMQSHFLRTFYVYNSRTMAGIQELVDEKLNPWLAKNSIITSVDWVKPQFEGSGTSRRNSNRIFDLLMQVEKRWDLVIIDEAHYVSTESNRSELARALQERCDSLLLLTATPHSGKPEYFFNLLNLIDPFMFAQPEDLDRPDARERVDKVMIRRGKETIFEIDSAGNLVKKFKDRQPHAIEIQFTDAERALYDKVSEYTSTGWAALSRKRAISASERNIGRFLLTLVQKRMVSSIYALRETLRRRIDSIVETRTVDRIEGYSTKEIHRLLRDYEKGAYLEDDDREAVERYLETRHVQAMYAERTNEIRTLRELLADAEALIQGGRDSKVQWLTDFLRQLFARDPQEKVIIFTEYRDTLNHLRRHLDDQWFLPSDAIIEIHGGMPLGDHDEEVGSKLHAERRFNEPDTRILLATDAAAEGLNLQRHCHILVNFELPWNPNRLEQRIGRIHRYGQRRIAQIYNLMIEDSKEAEIFKLLQEKIEIIRKQLGNMAEVLGVLERVSLDEVILRVLDRDLDEADVSEIAEQELAKLEELARSIQNTQFLSGVRHFTREDIEAAERAIRASQETIPTHADVQRFVETFLRVYGDEGPSQRNGRVLHPTRHKGVYRLYVPTVIQDDRIPQLYERVTFEREIATKDWSHQETPTFLAFGHPLLERMVHFCRTTKAAELGGKLSYLVTDYAGLPGVVFNFLLRFEDSVGRAVREELEPVFVDQMGTVHLGIGRKLYLAPELPEVPPSAETLAVLRQRITELKAAAESHIREHYTEYYERVERDRETEIALLMEDLERFDRGVSQDLKQRLISLTGGAVLLFDEMEESTVKGQRTRLENQLKMHEHRMKERRTEVENMRLGAFPAPEMLNMVLVLPA